MDVHEATTVISIRNVSGSVVRREVVATNRTELRAFFASIRGKVRIAIESGPLARYVAGVITSSKREVVICEGRRNRLILHGSKTDRVDADKLSELLRLGAVKPVFQANDETECLRRLSHHYLRLVADRGRVVQRLRSFLARIGLHVTQRTFASRAVPLRAVRNATDRQVIRALLHHIRLLTPLVKEARAVLLANASLSPSYLLLQSMPYVGPIRAAQ